MTSSRARHKHHLIFSARGRELSTGRFENRLCRALVFQPSCCPPFSRKANNIIPFAAIVRIFLIVEAGGANIDEDLVNKVFRATHSIKGGAGFMGLTTIQDLSHAAENVLGIIRGKKLIPTPEIINVLLIAADQLQIFLNKNVNLPSRKRKMRKIFCRISSLNIVSEYRLYCPRR